MEFSQTDRRRSRRSIFVAAAATLLLTSPALPQGTRGNITGRISDRTGAVLEGAIVQLEGTGHVATTNGKGEYLLADLAAGEYSLTFSYVGMAPTTQKATVSAGQATRVDLTMQVAEVSNEIIVVGDRPRGEAEAINRSRAADNIVQVLPSEVITSLPNANIADAIGRLPSVTLERDEGEGKYVHIRGTEPRLSNVTIDGINVPSPEGGVRQVKLDVLASDLVESIELNKTLQANQDGDGIGGSVNLRTKTAGDTPILSVFGIGGFTPIIGGRGLDQFGLTTGKRFGRDKRLGVLFGGTYDWNGRGINDIEPSPTVSSLSPHYDSIDLRDYKYYRTRWGLAGSTDYRLAQDSSIWLRGLFSTFRNWGQKWVYTLVDNDVPQASIDWRRPDFAIGNLVLGGHHALASSWFSWTASVSRSRMLASGGNGGAKFSWNGGTTNCYDDPSATTNPNRPQFAASCFTPGSTNAMDISNYQLQSFDLPSEGLSAQLNLSASASFGKFYRVGSHYGTFELGGKIRNGHKFDNSYPRSYDVASGNVIPINQFAGSFTDPNYYDGSFPAAKSNVDFTKIQAFVAGNPGLFTITGGPGANSNNFTYIERVSAGYLMNSIDLAPRWRLVTGVRFEATTLRTRSFDQNTGLINFTGSGDYLDVLPSASLRFAATQDSGIRFVYSRALSRPNPQDIAQAVGPIDDTQNPPTVSLGNPNLKAEHADNIDVLYEHYLKPLGLIQAGFFYKNLQDPIVATEARPTTGTYAGFLVSQPGNAGSAWLAGLEIGYQQHLSFLPGPFSGLGISANYSYTDSAAKNLPGRSDSPRLLRQAPHTWNVSPTYDRGRIALRVGLTYNGANIYAYQYQDLNPDGTKIDPSSLPAGGAFGPGGDNYLYAHLQVDAQGTIRLPHGFQLVAYGLNLTNEVFGFYNGSPQYVVQREYYKASYAIGMRWNLSGERH
jgi:outer membrane receptor protein involved in Fe transport